MAPLSIQTTDEFGAALNRTAKRAPPAAEINAAAPEVTVQDLAAPLSGLSNAAITIAIRVNSALVVVGAFRVARWIAVGDATARRAIYVGLRRPM